MRAIVVLVTALLVFCAAGAGWSETPADRDLRLANARLEKGRLELNTRLAQTDTNASRLAVLDRALYFLRGAKSVTTKTKGPAFAQLQREIDADLVRALDREAEIYFARTSLPLAKKRVQEALELDPHDLRATDLAAMIAAAENGVVYTGSRETVGRETSELRRQRERRAAIGVPLRDRAAPGTGGRR